MAFIERINDRQEFSSHGFNGLMYLYNYGFITRTQLVNRLKLVLRQGFDTNDETLLDQIKTIFDAQANVSAKLSFQLKFEACNILLEEGWITFIEYKNFLGLT